MRFFNPTPAFFKWIDKVFRSQTTKMPIIDCGCGDGDLVIELNRKKLPTIGIDFRYDSLSGVPLATRLLSMPAEDCGMIKNTPTILLTCRPCHDGFPGRINQIRHKDSLMFYVGLEHNMEFDLSGGKTKLELSDAGKEGECVWSVTRGTSHDDVDFRLEILSGERRLRLHPNLSP